MRPDIDKLKSQATQARMMSSDDLIFTPFYDQFPMTVLELIEYIEALEKIDEERETAYRRLVGPPRQGVGLGTDEGKHE